MTYEVFMSNGDCAECETAGAALVAAKTMCDDSGGKSNIERITKHGAFDAELTSVARRLQIEELAIS